METPSGSFRPWQVAVAVLLLMLVLGAAIGLALISPFAVAGLVPVLGAIRKLVPRLLRVEESEAT